LWDIKGLDAVSIPHRFFSISALIQRGAAAAQRTSIRLFWKTEFAYVLFCKIGGWTRASSRRARRLELDDSRLNRSSVIASGAKQSKDRDFKGNGRAGSAS
jgi:hypothetical protein